MKIDLTDRRNIYFCTDVHGEWDKLNFFLNEVGFNYRDAIVCAGDMIDRGDKNLEVVNFFLLADNAYAVRGNHEQMAIDAVLGKDRRNYAMWRMNGGAWADDYPTVMIDGLVRQMNINFPYYLEVQVENTKIAVVHAEVPNGDFETYKRVAGNNHALDQHAIWGRRAIEAEARLPVVGADFTLHGHTVKETITKIQNQIWFDTGGVFDCGDEVYGLTILEFNRETKEFVTHKVVLDPLAGKANRYKLV
ncbi:serine/threonine protein phosphatase [Vibrio phage JSF12]|uniref:Serine/threonine protein phosphatase n=3 Tax=Jesfedecavirus TaxID=2560156 RepID=A0A2D0YXP5_9CAUD|nr:NinI-like serine-threonine phosphatase [Vibrio phage phi 3]YP_009618541.1 NinI-like serine-threonine phosphatase [Vibrio phage JSF10]YP_009794749.1 NinI-like serine-threonine phosphatase [Vibrio phage JSF12]AJF40803.1 calcineurin-like phosphoesterase family protein [Vibrio phage phi 3]ASV43514.1 serine/threonine protein phosphatase [Vibrio phage JSF10]ASV43584.1 serine/threonine protein phosphatase [Vibrio phage JSF12]